MIRTYTTTALRITLVTGAVVVLGYLLGFQGLVSSTFATSSGTGALEVTIDNHTWYNGVLQPKLSWSLKHVVAWCDHFFSFDDVKPGDTGTTTVSVHVKNGPAWACLDFTNLVDKENGMTEPESLVDHTPNVGELSSMLEFFAWNDDGDNTFEIGEKPLFGTSTQAAIQVFASTTYPLADYLHGAAYANNSTHYIGINWCAGDLNVNLATAKVTCNGQVMGNQSQTDSMNVDVSIRSVSSNSQPKFTCVTAPVVPKCEIEGHKYDQNGNPLQGWEIGLSKVIKHNKGSDTYDLATAVTDKDGYFCLDWDGVKQVPRGSVTYKSGPSTYTYQVYEKMKTDWQNVSVEKGINYHSVSVVPGNQIITQGQYVGVQIGDQNGSLSMNGEYHVDFYNKKFNRYVKDFEDGCKRIAQDVWDRVSGHKENES